MAIYFSFAFVWHVSQNNSLAIRQFEFFRWDITWSTRNRLLFVCLSKLFWRFQTQYFSWRLLFEAASIGSRSFVKSVEAMKSINFILKINEYIVFNDWSYVCFRWNLMVLYNSHEYTNGDRTGLLYKLFAIFLEI